MVVQETGIITVEARKGRHRKYRKVTPAKATLEWLEQSGNLAAYMERLVTAFNPAAASGVMCRNTLSVGWDGQLYDCDFNQMLDLPVEAGAPRHIRDFDLAKLEARAIVTYNPTTNLWYWDGTYSFNPPRD